jgi:hypothetical protein
MNMLEKISSNALCMPYQASQRYYVLDEVDNLNVQAMAVLKSVMNTPGCVFILTPEFDSKSRFFPFSPIRLQQNQALTADVLNFL